VERSALLRKQPRIKQSRREDFVERLSPWRNLSEKRSSPRREELRGEHD